MGKRNRKPSADGQDGSNRFRETEATNQNRGEHQTHGNENTRTPVTSKPLKRAPKHQENSDSEQNPLHGVGHQNVQTDYRRHQEQHRF